MAPLKRVRRDDVDDDEIVAVESASSSLRQDIQRKKVRLSAPGASKSRSAREQNPSSDSSDDDSDEDLSDADADTGNNPPATQYELLRDGDFEHLKHPDLDDQRATQVFLSRRQTIGDNHAANNAIIEEITCINFMCHDRLHVVLGPLINFIVGHNGSGKSAVLTAITLCLGGKAAATNRGASLKSLIKEGKDQGLLIIKLKNQGNDAYQPDLYGPSIIIERHFSRSGSSGFKLKNANGKLISSKKGDVDDVTEYYQLQVDNPMNVLTQDAAKTFITASTPAQKYKFFKEGVQLQALDQDYKLVCDLCDQIQHTLDESNGDVKELQKQAEIAKARFDELQQQQGLKAKARETLNQLSWAQVEGVEAGLATSVRHVAAAQEQLDSAQREKEDKDHAFQKIELLLARHKASEHELAEEIQPLIAEVERAEEAHNEAKKKVADARTTRNIMSGHVHTAKLKVSQCENDIEAEKKLVADANGGVHTRKRSELEAAQQAAAEAKAAFESHQNELPHLEEQKQEARQAVDRLNGPLSQKRAEVDASRRKLQGLNNDRGDVMAGFDRNMPRLLQTIQSDNGFREKPVGPLGRHIKLRNPDWSNVLESTIGLVLTGFIVTSKHDQARLAGILRQFNMDYCPILIGNNSPIDTTGHEPDDQYDTILRVLDIDHDMVRRQLILNQGIEQSLLIKDRGTAIRVMYDGARPRNVKQAFAINSKQRGWGFRLGYMGSDGGRDLGPVQPPKGKPRMKTDVESRIAYERDTLQQLERELHDMERERQRLQSNVQRCETAIVQYKREQGRLKVVSQRADETVDSLNAELDSLEIDDGRLDILKTELAEAQEELRIAEEAYGAVALEKEPLNRESTEKKRELDAAKVRVAEQETKLTKARTKVRNSEQARRMALDETNTASVAIAQAEAAKEAAEKDRQERVTRVADFIEQAQRICPRVPVPLGETHASLAAKYEQLRLQKERFRKRMGATEDEINAAALETEQRYRTRKQNQEGLKDLLVLLKQSFMKRIGMFKRFQRHISASSRINFTYLLSERAFRGKLTIDHVNKKLDVHVEPDETTKSGKGRQTKTLSGGEKSFSSICLLLSLWEAMGAPLRCLDEFDVFMDDVNRDVSTKMLISAARKSVGRQFILITPKALGAGVSEGAQDVHIIKLFDPRDKQRRIDDMMEE